MHPIRLAVCAAALLVVPVLPASAQGMTVMPPPPLSAGTRAPAFRTQTVNGRPLSLASLRGKVVLLDYWATWCGPCRMAMPTLRALQQKYHRQGFTVVGMSVDGTDTISQVKPFVKALHISYPITVAVSANTYAKKAYHVTGIPSQYLIDKKGIVRWSQSGYSLDEGQRLPVLIRKLLAEH